MIKKWSIFLGLTMGLILAGCSQKEYEPIKVDKVSEDKDTDKITLRFLYSGGDTNWSSSLEEVCNDFMLENPNIEIITENAGDGIYTEKLKVSEAIGELPDIFEIQDVENFVRSEKVGKIPKSVERLLEDKNYIDGEVYAVPVYATTYGVIYNQKIFKDYNLETPKNYEEFIKICDVLKGNNVMPIIAGGSKNDSSVYWSNYFYQTDILSHNEEWQSGLVNGENGFQDAGVVTLFEDYQNLMTGPYMLKESLRMSDSQVITKLLNLEAAMYYTKPAFFSTMLMADSEVLDSDRDNYGKEIENDTAKYRFSWFFMPDKMGNIMAAKEIGAQLAISKKCADNQEKMEAAEKFLLFCFREDQYRKILKNMYGFPTTKNKILYPAPAVQQELLVDYRYAKKYDAFLGSDIIAGNFRNQLSQTLNLLANHSVSPREAAEMLEKAWSETHDK